MYWYDIEISPSRSQYTKKAYDILFNFYESTDKDACMTEAKQLSIEQQIEAWSCLNFLHYTHWGTAIGIKRNWVEEHQFYDQRSPISPKPLTYAFKHKIVRANCIALTQSALNTTY